MGIEELLKLANTGSSALTPIGAISSGIQGIAGLIGNIKAKKQYNQAEEAFKRAQGSRPSFQIAPEVKQQLAMQQAQYNAEDESIKQAKAAQDQALANYMGSAQRNASSGAQALATAGEVAGNTMQGAARLAGQQFQNQMQKNQMLGQAQGAMAQQRAMQFQDALSANQELQGYQLGKMQAERSNINESNKNIFSAIPGVIGGLGMAYKGLKGLKPTQSYETGSGIPSLSDTYNYNSFSNPFTKR